jgi:hypothetical protein
MVMTLRGYCRGCGQARPDPAAAEALCPRCRVGQAGLGLDRLLSHSGVDVLAGIDRDSIQRLRQLRRRLRVMRPTG